MADVLTRAQRSFNMSRIRGADTRPEMIVRRAIHGAGFRYRLHVAGLAGKPDLVFPAARTVLFVHGCFWHMHRCRYGKPAPATNRTFWANKRRSNVERDRRNRTTLRRDGWAVFEIWECATKDAAKLNVRLQPVLKHLRAVRQRTYK